jgi:selenium metabolism protein YedF
MVDADYLLIVTSSGIGESEPDLGSRLIESFFRVLADSEALPAKIIFLNAGVFLTTMGSPVEESLTTLEAKGVEIRTCGTCLRYFDRKGSLVAGTPTDMRDTVESLGRFAKVVRL